MLRRRTTLLSAVWLLACLAILPACKKKPADTGSGGTEPTPTPVTPAVTSSDYLLFAHLRAKDIRESALFSEIKQAFAKADAAADMDQLEAKVAKEFGGVKPTDIDAVTVAVTEVPNNSMPKVVLIVNSNKPFDKAAMFKLGPQAKPDARGFYSIPGGERALAHFPDDKTLAVVHPDLAQRYLDGYGKNRSGWPMSAAMTREASNHTLYAVVQVQKAPRELINSPDARQFSSLLAARTLTLTADLKGKELSVAARASYPDATAATKAKESVQQFIGMGTNLIESAMSGKGPPELGGELAGLMPAVKEAHRALKEAKVEVRGTDLLVSGNYRADFDIGAMVVDAAKKFQGASERMTASNNLKQIGLAFHNYHSAFNLVPIHGVGPKGVALKTATEKPLLSWRVALLPYLEQDNLYREFKLDEPWDSSHNKKLIEKMPKVYAPVNKPGKPGYTHMQMVVGPNAMQLPSVKFPASFPDGMSNTIAVAEAADPVIWTKPDDVMLPGMDLPKDLKKKFGGLEPGGFFVLTWDGAVRFVKDSVSDLTLSRAINPRDGQVLGKDW